MSKRVIVNIDLAIEVPEGEDPMDYAENYELPHGYVEDSFEFVRIEDDNENTAT